MDDGTRATKDQGGLRHFWRSLRYLRPYRARLGLSVLCVVGISLLWGGGLGMLVPGSKILISEEGLHGWVYGMVAGDRLEADLLQRSTPAGTHLGGRDVVEVLDVLAVHRNGRAARAGIEKGDWLIGLEGGDPARSLLRGRELAQALAATGAGTPVQLRIYRFADRTDRRVAMPLGEMKWMSRMLGSVVAAIPEPQDRPGRYDMFMGLLGVVLAATVLRELLRFAQEYLVETAINRSIMDIRCETYSVVLGLPTTYFSQQGITDTMSRFVNDTNELRTGHITLFGKTLAEPGKALASLVAAALLSWKLTLLALLVGPPTYWIIRQFGKRMHRAARKMLESWSGMTGVLEETLLGIRVVKAYTMEQAERKRFFQVNRRLLKQFNKMAKIEAGTSPAIEALGITAACGAGALAGCWVLNYAMKVDDFLAYMACLATMFDPLRKLAKVGTRFQRSDAAAARIFEVRDLQREKVVPGAPMLPRHSRTIEFRGVSFRYPAAAVDALKDVSLTIQAGQTVAIVGPNGSGKTTLASLVPRLLDPTAGQVLIDGQDISQVSLRSLRRQIGLVTQETIIFHATVFENIAYGLRRPRPQAVLAASQKAFVDEFIRDLPGGYDTMVGEHGSTLSGGQRQRIAIARAIIRDPAILIFDEALSQIDPDSEKRIHQAMAEFIRNRTTLMIAHRFQTVLSANVVVVMDGGRVVDTGAHADLMDRCRLYRHLYQTQFARPSEGAPRGQT